MYLCNKLSHIWLFKMWVKDDNNGKNHCFSQSERRCRKDHDHHQPCRVTRNVGEESPRSGRRPPGQRLSGLGVDISQVDCSIYECIIDHADVRDAIYTTDIDGLDIIPSHIDLVGAEIEMLNLNDREKVLKNILDPLREEYDYILIDCSPSLGLITVNALTAANSVIIPVQCEYFALEGISKLLNTIKIIKSRLNPKLEIEGFLLTMYDSRLRLANQIYDEVKRHFQELVFKTVIQRNVKLSEAPSHGLPVILYDADSSGAKNHLALAKEIIDKNV